MRITGTCLHVVQLASATATATRFATSTSKWYAGPNMLSHDSMLKGNVRSRLAKLYTAEKLVDVVEEEEEQRPRRGTWSSRRQRRGLI